MGSAHTENAGFWDLYTCYKWTIIVTLSFLTQAFELHRYILIFLENPSSLEHEQKESLGKEEYISLSSGYTVRFP